MFNPNPPYITICHCEKPVLKIMIMDRWYTLCQDCYGNSLPDIPGMTNEQIYMILAQFNNLTTVSTQILLNVLKKFEGFEDGREIIKDFMGECAAELMNRKLDQAPDFSLK